MPKLTNRHGLPDAFIRYAEKDPYSKGDADFSVTELIDAPQIAHLKRVHDADLEEDVADRIMSMLGTATHEILQHSADPGDVTEKRFFADVLGYRVSGQADLLQPIAPAMGDPVAWALKDYKVTRGTSIVMNPKGSTSWINQINVYSYLAEINGYPVMEGEVIAILRDWTASLVRRNANFPKQPIVRVPIEIWPFEQRKAYLEERVRLHTKETPDPCTDEERWKGRTVFAVTEYRKDGGLKARAKRLFESETDAMAFVMDEGIQAEIIRRDPQPTRCDGNYCQVAQFCNQWLSE